MFGFIDLSFLMSQEAWEAVAINGRSCYSKKSEVTYYFSYSNIVIKAQDLIAWSEA